MQNTLKKLGPVIRLLLSAGLIGYLICTVDFKPLAEVLPQFRWEFYAAGLAVMMFYVVLQGFIINQLLNDRGITTSWGQMIRLNFISSFFGVFLPGGAGADVVMTFNLYRDAHDKANVLSCILFARVAGLSAMTLLAFIISITVGSPVPGLTMVTGAILLALAAIIALNAFGLISVLQKKLFTPFAHIRLVSFVSRFIESLCSITSSYRVLLVVVPTFLLMGVCRALMDYFMARSMGVTIPFSNFIVFSTVVSIVTVLPISIAGLGVREVTFTGLFALVGVAQAVAVSISLLSFSLSLWVCLVGGILYATKGWRQSS